MGIETILRCVPYFHRFNQGEIGYLFWLCGLFDYYTGKYVTCPAIGDSEKMGPSTQPLYKLLMKKIKTSPGMGSYFILEEHTYNYFIPNLITSPRKFILTRTFLNESRLVLFHKTDICCNFFSAPNSVNEIFIFLPFFMNFPLGSLTNDMYHYTRFQKSKKSREKFLSYSVLGYGKENLILQFRKIQDEEGDFYLYLSIYLFMVAPTVFHSFYLEGYMRKKIITLTSCFIFYCNDHNPIGRFLIRKKKGYDTARIIKYDLWNFIYYARQKDKAYFEKCKFKNCQRKSDFFGFDPLTLTVFNIANKQFDDSRENHAALPVEIKSEDRDGHEYRFAYDKQDFASVFLIEEKVRELFFLIQKYLETEKNYKLASFVDWYDDDDITTSNVDSVKWEEYFYKKIFLQKCM